MGTVKRLAEEVEDGLWVALFEWLHAHDWGYRLRLKGNLLADAGFGDKTTTGDWARGVKECYLPGVRLFAEGISTNLGILHEPGHKGRP